MKALLEPFELSGTDPAAGTWIGSEALDSQGKILEVFSPVDGQQIGKVITSDLDVYNEVVTAAKSAFEIWRNEPAPRRGEFIRQVGQRLRKYKVALGKLVSYEMGKSLQEGYGEVQEMIDICDFAVGLARQLCGQTMHSERPQHRMYEQWHPLGVVGIISAFNFPVAVWSWNAMIALACGNVCLWKPSEKTPLTALACQFIIGQVLEENKLPAAISSLVVGTYELGEQLAKDKNIALLSATGSTKMGKAVGTNVMQRFGKSLLELGGNNAVIITPKADLKIAIPAVVFGAIGTAGQRCTTTRRLIVHESISQTVKDSLLKAYRQLCIGDPLLEKNHIGPLIDRAAVKLYLEALERCRKAGADFITEGGTLTGLGYESGCYVKPSIVELKPDSELLQDEVFAPLLYFMTYKNLTEAIKIQNAVPQGLSSAIMTTDIKEAETFLSHAGSDCGIANVNIGTSGAEIGGAFGGEKETGGGRESGSDAWKYYMRRQTVTINYSNKLPLAQGIKFNI